MSFQEGSLEYKRRDFVHCLAPLPLFIYFSLLLSNLSILDHWGPPEVWKIAEFH